MDLSGRKAAATSQGRRTSTPPCAYRRTDHAQPWTLPTVPATSTSGPGTSHVAENASDIRSEAGSCVHAGRRTVTSSRSARFEPESGRSYRKNVTSGQPDEQLTTGPEDKIAPEWSRDGRYLVFIQIGTTTAEDIFALALDGDRHPFPVLQTPAIETNPALSPDGRWLAFESSYSGRPEVYVTRFPSSGSAVADAPRWQVSTQGGSRPRWSGDGRALYYVSLDDLRIMQADVRTALRRSRTTRPACSPRFPSCRSRERPLTSRRMDDCCCSSAQSLREFRSPSSPTGER